MMMPDLKILRIAFFGVLLTLSALGPVHNAYAYSIYSGTDNTSSGLQGSFNDLSVPFQNFLKTLGQDTVNIGPVTGASIPSASNDWLYQKTGLNLSGISNVIMAWFTAAVGWLGGAYHTLMHYLT